MCLVEKILLGICSQESRYFSNERFNAVSYEIDNIINSLSFDYLIIACNESKHEYIRNKAFEKVNEMFDEIEQDEEIREELMEKINNDIKVRRKSYGKY